MTTNATFVVIFCFSYETRVKDNNERVLSLSSSLFPYIVENNDEPPHSSLSSVIQKKKHKNPNEDDEAHPHLLQPKKKNLDVGFS
jgi:hypothetical protein